GGGAGGVGTCSPQLSLHELAEEALDVLRRLGADADELPLRDDHVVGADRAGEDRPAVAGDEHPGPLPAPGWYVDDAAPVVDGRILDVRAPDERVRRDLLDVALPLSREAGHQDAGVPQRHVAAAGPRPLQRRP